MNLSALVTDFLEYLKFERNASRLTIKNYGHYLKRFLEFTRLDTNQTNSLDPKDIDLILVNKYKLYLSNYLDPKTKKPLKKVTQNYFYIALRAFLRYLAIINIVTLLPEQVELGESDPGPLKILDDTELKSLLQAPDTTKKDGIRDRCILETLFSTGLRVSELTSLNKDIINLTRREFGVMVKGSKERMVFISDSAANWLEKYLSLRNDSFAPLFIRFQGKVDSTNNGEAMRLTSRSIERIAEKYVKRLGLSVKATPHTLRHCHALKIKIDKQRLVL